MSLIEFETLRCLMISKCNLSEYFNLYNLTLGYIMKAYFKSFTDQKIKPKIDFFFSFLVWRFLKFQKSETQALFPFVGKY